jgi:chloramphenicol-sensitive protein RarD
MHTLTDKQRGTLLGISAYLIWGFAALYWVQTEPVDTLDLLAHRALWSVPVVVVCLLAVRRLYAALVLFRQPRTVAIMALAAALSATNWGIFIWAVTHERAMEASLGYFLLPLVNVVIGLLLFKETIDGAQKIGVAFAATAVILQFSYYGSLPLVSLGVAVSFGLYGAIRKGVAVESMEGLLMETLLMSPFAIVWLVLRDGGGLGEHGPMVDALLLGAGLITAVPLLTYVSASRLLPLTALGLVFYIGPTAQLLVAIFVFDEPFNLVQVLAFGLVWLGLVIVTADGFRRARQAARLRAIVARNRE